MAASTSSGTSVGRLYVQSFGLARDSQRRALSTHGNKNLGAQAFSSRRPSIEDSSLHYRRRVVRILDLAAKNPGGGNDLADDLWGPIKRDKANDDTTR